MFRPKKQQPQFADLKGVLSQSKQTDNPLYQAVEEIINRLTQFQQVTLEEVADINNSINSSLSTINNNIQNLTQIIGSIVVQHYDCPLSDGDEIEAELIYAAGECIIVQVPI